MSFFDKIAEHISDLLGIDFFIPFSSYYKIRDISYRNPNYIFFDDCDRNKVFDNLIPTTAALSSGGIVILILFKFS